MGGSDGSSLHRLISFPFQAEGGTRFLWKLGRTLNLAGTLREWCDAEIETAGKARLSSPGREAKLENRQEPDVSDTCWAAITAPIPRYL